MAYQIAFDLYESATQQFLGRVLQALRATAPIPAATNKIVKVPVEGAAKEEASGESSSEVADEEKKPERKMESLVSQTIFSFGFRCAVSPALRGSHLNISNDLLTCCCSSVPIFYESQRFISVFTETHHQFCDFCI